MAQKIKIKRVTLHPIKKDGTVDISTNLYPKTLISGIVDENGNEVEVQSKLKSGQTIKTINGQSILGSGNIDIQGGSGEPGQKGEDGITPHIGENGNWFIGDTDTGVCARGVDGAKGEDGAQGPAGPAGAQGPQGPAGKDGKGFNIKASGIECTEIDDAYINNEGRLIVLKENNTWLDVGLVRGPQGIQGERGYKGDQGAPGYISYFVPNADMVTEVGQAYVDDNGRLQVCTSISPKLFEDAGYIRGPKGIDGARGPQGERGPEGYVKGFRYNQEDIEEVGEAYVDSNGDLYICTSLEPLEFKAWGNIKGPAGPQGPRGYTGEKGDTGYVKKFVSDLAYVTEVGDAFVDSNNGHLYVCTSIDPKKFDDVGDIRGPQGSRGYTGEKGEKGDKGDTGNVSAFFFDADEVTEVGQAYLDEDGNVQVCDSIDPKHFVIKGNLKGPQGIQGARGAKGDMGFVKSFVPNAAAVTSVGQAYIDNNNHLQVCVSLEPTITFEDAGVIQGPQGEKGETGPQGPQGIQGPAGQDAVLPNFKTINNESIIGTGNIEIEGGAEITVDQEFNSSSNNAIANSPVTNKFNQVDSKLDQIATVLDDLNVETPFWSTIAGQGSLNAADEDALEELGVEIIYLPSSNQFVDPNNYDWYNIGAAIQGNYDIPRIVIRFTEPAENSNIYINNLRINGTTKHVRNYSTYIENNESIIQEVIFLEFNDGYSEDYDSRASLLTTGNELIIGFGDHSQEE